MNFSWNFYGLLCWLIFGIACEEMSIIDVMWFVSLAIKCLSNGTIILRFTPSSISCVDVETRYNNDVHVAI